MKDYEKEIEGAAEAVVEAEIINREIIKLFFIKGAKSSEAKEFHQQDMYSKKHVISAVARVYGNNGMTSTGAQLLREVTNDPKWSSRDLPTFYSEKEVLEMIENYNEYYTSSASPVDTPDMWFNKNKKKS